MNHKDHCPQSVDPTYECCNCYSDFLTRDQKELDDKMIQASDGTPVSDLKEHIKELQALLQKNRKAFQKIVNHVNAPHWNTARKYEIRDTAQAALNEMKQP